MIVVGLTGSIGMGKSTVAGYIRSRGIAVLDADKIVHNLYEGEAAPLIEAAFPGTAPNGVVDRTALAGHVLASKAALEKLEHIVHPLVRAAEWRFLEAEQMKGADLAVLEIPLLFETGTHKFFDVIIVVSAPEHVQRERIMARPGMTSEKLSAMLARQWPDEQKRERADFIVDTNLPPEDTFAQIDAILAQIMAKPALAYQRWADAMQE